MVYGYWITASDFQIQNAHLLVDFTRKVQKNTIHANHGKSSKSNPKQLL